MKFPLSCLCLFLLLGLPVSAAPKETPTPPPPPMPQDQNISIYRGRTIEIPLRAIGRANGQLKFIVRTKPKYGKLGEIKFTGNKSAVVTYTHNETSGAGSDSFTYAAQTLGTAVSAPARVQITVSENPPAFSVVHAVDFESVLIGEPREEEITIRNTGGGILSGTIIAPPPWKVLGASTYQLERKEEQRVRILFDPADARDYTEKLVFSHDARSPVTLTGSARSPFEFQPAQKIELSSQGDETVRSGGLIIRNTTSRERVVEITSPTHISAPEQISVGAQGEARVPFYTAPDFLREVLGEVRLESEGFQRSIPLEAPPLRAILQIEPTALNFGRLTIGESKRLSVQVANTGGRAARLRFTTPPDLLLLPDPNSAVIEPGDRRTFQAVLETRATGSYQGDIEISAESGPALRLPVRADVAKPGSTVLPPTATVVAPTEAPQPVPPAAKSSFSETEAPLAGLTVTQVAPRTIEVSWPKPAANTISALVEQRFVGKNGTYSWKKLDSQNIKISQRDEHIVVRLHNLAPGQFWFLRFVSVDDIGVQSLPSQVIRLATAPPRRSPVVWVVLALVVAALAGGVFFLVRRNLQAGAALEADRLSRIEGK